MTQKFNRKYLVVHTRDYVIIIITFHKFDISAAREKELHKTQQEKKKLAEKLQMLEGKLIVGGVDLVSNSSNK